MLDILVIIWRLDSDTMHFSSERLFFLFGLWFTRPAPECGCCCWWRLPWPMTDEQHRTRAAQQLIAAEDEGPEKWCIRVCCWPVLEVPCGDAPPPVTLRSMTVCGGGVLQFNKIERRWLFIGTVKVEIFPLCLELRKLLWSINILYNTVLSYSVYQLWYVDQGQRRSNAKDCATILFGTIVTASDIALSSAIRIARTILQLLASLTGFCLSRTKKFRKQRYLRSIQANNLRDSSLDQLLLKFRSSNKPSS